MEPTVRVPRWNVADSAPLVARMLVAVGLIALRKRFVSALLATHDPRRLHACGTVEEAEEHGTDEAAPMRARSDRSATRERSIDFPFVDGADGATPRNIGRSRTSRENNYEG